MTIHFKTFDMALEDLFPVYLPCYVIKAMYDAQAFTMYVSGSEGKVGGPFLINALAAARVSAVAVLGTAILAVPSKAIAALAGSVAAAATYVAVFYAAKFYPGWRRDRNRRQRDEARVQHADEDRSGYRPDLTSRRVTEEYHRSSFWDSHPYQRRVAPSSSPTSDPKGYYHLLGLAGNESVNEIRSAYRHKVLESHPDVGGSAEKIVKLNEAYRVLRDSKSRSEYDRSGVTLKKKGGGGGFGSPPPIRS